MAIGPIESNIFTNQQLPNVASVAQSYITRLEQQELFAQSLAKEKKQEVEEVRPTEENEATNPDNEHEKDMADQQNRRNPKKTKEQGEPKPSRHILDIKV
ncbi:MAG: hypothetical protein WC144_08345 [Sulfurimonas sp.]|jgi:RNA polymerase-binding transcription factor DksA|nr:hypothetical protein [Sulfurimonadaceae bacterium]